MSLLDLAGAAHPIKLRPLKRGDTFALNADISNADGDPVEYLPSQVRAQIRQRNDLLVDTLQVSSTETPGRYTLVAADTSNWPIGTLEMDIEVDNGEAIMSSVTIQIPIIKDITRIE